MGSSGPGIPMGLPKGEITKMNSIVGKSTGIALLMAAALLAALFSMGVFSASGVGAHTPDVDDCDTEGLPTLSGNTACDDDHPSFHLGTIADASVSLSNSLPGATGVEMTIKFKPGPNSTTNDQGETTYHSIVITVPVVEAATGSMFGGLPQDENDADADLEPTVKQGDIEPTFTVALGVITIAPAASDAVNYESGEEIEVVIKGLINPNDTDLTNDTGVMIAHATATAVDAGAGGSISSGDLSLSSATAGAAVQVVIKAWAEDSKNSANDITVDLAKFGVPSSITERSIIIEDVNAADDEGQGIGANLDPQYIGEPGSIVVSGTKVTLALFARFPGADGPAGTLTNEYRITFKQSAGITNPAVAGTATVTVNDGDLPDSHKLTSSINSVVSLKPAAGARGTAATVSVVGIGAGGATAYLVQGDCPDQAADCPDNDAEDISLGNGTASGGKVSIEIDTSSSDFEPGVHQINKDGDIAPGPTYKATDYLRGLNQITIVDGTGRTADKVAYFTITPTIEVDEEAAQQGDELTITFDDWTYGDITAVTIGDEDVSDFDDGSGTDFEIDIIVPPEARLGEQQLKVTGTSDNQEGSLTNLKKDVAKGTVTIGALDITVDPPTFVLGQQFTVKVSGLSADPPANDPDTDENESAADPIQYVKVGDVKLNNTTGNVSIEDIDIDTNGNFNNTFVISSSYKETGDSQEASEKLTPGSYRVEVKDWTGRIAVGRITIPEPTITVTPSVSRRGTTVTVAGENFPAVRVVQVYYGEVKDENLQGAVLADSAGRLNINFTVPSNAEIGEEQDVTAQSAAMPSNKFRAKASHELPPQEIIVTPMQVTSGGRLRIEGHNMPLFTIVKLNIAGIAVAGTGAETDNLGSFVKQEVLVPQLKAGTHTVEASVSTQGAADEKVRTTVEIVDALSVGTPAELFASQIEAGVLDRIFRYENDTQEWFLYDPDPGFEAANSLESLASGNIIWIQLKAAATVQGTNFLPGWVLITVQ